MATTNNVTSIFLLGFPNLQNFTCVFFSLLVFVYCGTISGNLLIMVLYLVSKTLQSPMYFFITQLSLCDLLLTTDIVPVLLHTVLYGGSSITLIGCMVQFSFFANSECSECFLLSVMSYDRYLAICNPLRYHSIMNHKLCVILVDIIWLLGFIVTLIDVFSIYSLHFCGPHIINHFYCDLEPILQLSCSDTSIIHIQGLILGFIFVMAPFIVIVTSYVYIAVTILKIPSNTGRHKAFSTCSSHLIVVSIFYGTLMIVYMFPTKGQSLTTSKVLSLMYTVLTPLLNPIIYTLRNKDFKDAFLKIKMEKLCSLLGILLPRTIGACISWTLRIKGASLKEMFQTGTIETEVQQCCLSGRHQVRFLKDGLEFSEELVPEGSSHATAFPERRLIKKVTFVTNWQGISSICKKHLGREEHESLDYVVICHTG
ncbi:olfactory receptor 10C1-like [Engystomops pustulosus]|uniref:olfactory receptor 10C1-like n=1 Tax=Engystomops pustulosus TaxID=76066 RepID=UPI003AFB230C